MVHELTLPTEEFIARVIDHIPDARLHGVRYAGLLSPRTKRVRYTAFLRLLGQLRPRKVRRFRWSTSLILTFGVDPLRDSQGNRLIWSYRIPPRLNAETRAP